MIWTALALVPALVAPAPPETAVAAALDAWHAAAARADEAAYFDLFAEEGVFLGTDATERWDKAAFRAFAHPFFAKGRAWTFRAVRRQVAMAAGGTVAYFDEDLETANLGPCRGSGVLELRGGAWRLLQYNLAVPIPNDLMKEVMGRIGDHLRKQAPPAPAASR